MYSIPPSAPPHHITCTPTSTSLPYRQPVSNHDELMSNFFAQPDALACGKTLEELEVEGVKVRVYMYIHIYVCIYYICVYIICVYPSSVGGSAARRWRSSRWRGSR